MGWYDGNPAHLHPLPPEESTPVREAWGEPPPCASGPAPPSTPASTGGWPELVDRWCSRGGDNREAPKYCWPTPSSRWPTRPSRAPGATCTSPGPLSCGRAWTRTPMSAISGNDVQRAMSLEMISDYMAISLNGWRGRRQGHPGSGPSITDLLDREPAPAGERRAQPLLRRAESADVTITLTRGDLDLILARIRKPNRGWLGEVEGGGAMGTLGELFSLIVQFDTVFNVNVPRKPRRSLLTAPGFP